MVFKLILYWRKDVPSLKLFYFLKVSLLSFIFVWVLLIFININIVFWGNNSYYPIKFNIFLYFIPYNTVIFNQNPQNFIISKTIVFSLFKNMICCILICPTAQKFASLVATPVWKNSVLMHFSNTLDTSIGDSLIYFWRKLTLAS